MHQNYRKSIYNVEEKVLLFVFFISGIELLEFVARAEKAHRQEQGVHRGLIKPVSSSFIVDIMGKGWGSLFQPTFLGE